MISNECKYCAIEPDRLLLEVSGVTIVAPERRHLAPIDGGHLLVVPKRHVPDRRSLEPTEVLAVELASMICADTLRSVFHADWQNYQENGNWSLGPEDQAHMHLHVYGRSKRSVTQPFGEALVFPRSDLLDEWTVAGPSLAEYVAVRRSLEIISSTRYETFRRILAAGLENRKSNV